MKNIKTLWKDNKKKIIVGTIVGVGATAAILTRKYYKGNFWLVRKELSMISWKPVGKYRNLEGVKELLEVAGDSNETFAIVKEGNLGKDLYTCIRLNVIK